MSAPSRRSMELSLGALFLVALALLAYMAMRMGSLSGFGDVVSLTVRFPDASGLVQDAAVKIAGVEVGKVKSLTIDFDHAVAKLQLQASAEVRKDAIVAIKARSLLGEKFVEISPVSRDAPLAQDGDTLTAASPGLEIEELASLLGPTIEGLQVEELSQGAQRVLAMVERQEEPIQGIIARIDRLLARAETVPFDDPAMYADLKASLSALRATAQALPQLTDDARVTVASARGLVTSLEPTLAKVNTSAQELPELVTTAKLTLKQANELLAILEPEARRLKEINYAMVRYIFRNEGLLLRGMERDVPQFDPGISWEDTPRPFTPSKGELDDLSFPGSELDRDSSGGPMSQGPGR